MLLLTIVLFGAGGTVGIIFLVKLTKKSSKKLVCGHLCVCFVNFVFINHHQFMVIYRIMCTFENVAFNFYFIFLEKIHLVENLV